MRSLSWIRSLLRPASLPIAKRNTVRPAIDLLENRLTPSTVPSIDGTGHNAAHPEWGSAGSDQLRMGPVAYTDKIGTPVSGPNARAISNALADQPADFATNDREMSAFIYAWGQFVDHDLDLTNSASPKESFNISVPAGDPYFDPASTGTQVIPLSRSKYHGGVTTPRMLVNDITAWMDGSMVYGSDAATATSLRTMSGGHMKTSAGNLLPVDAASGQFLAGDIRANENPELTSLQTLFVREHNRIADQIAAKNPGMSDEDLYQAARIRVIAEIQAITYNEFLPALLGPAAPGPYRGYNPNVNPGISVEFSTAAFRVGHTLVGDDIEFLDNNGNEVHEEVSLAEAFFNAGLVKETGIDPILKYLASDHAQEVDTKIVGGLRNFLFGPPGAGGLDLAALNIQRGRDHGLADYNTVRAAYGLPRVKSFAEITPDKNLQAALQKVYGSVDKIDLWVGGLAEKHLQGASVGPTFARIIGDQFSRLRDGDSFWYQNVFKNTPELDPLSKTTLAGVIRRNSVITNLQDNVFFFHTSISGKITPPAGTTTKPPLGGITVNLLDAAGAVVATTKTLADGSYIFSGLDLGIYKVQVKFPNSTATSKAVAITKGMDIRDINFELPKAENPLPPPVGSPLPKK